MKKSRRVLPDGNYVGLEHFGHALLHFAETGDRSKLDTSVYSMSTIAKAIIAIARGEDAREVFGQTGKRGRQSQRLYQQTRAFVYWQARAKNPPDVAGAVRAAQTHFSYLPEPSRASIERTARKYREHCLEVLTVKGWRRRADGSVETIPWDFSIEPLLAHLAQKSKRGK